MSANLHEQYIHKLIRRRMRWVFMLMVVLCSSPFIASLMKDDIGLKGFMRPSLNSPRSSFLDVAPPQGVTRQGEEMPKRVAVILWDEKDKNKNDNTGISCHGLNVDTQDKDGVDPCTGNTPNIISEHILL